MSSAASSRDGGRDHIIGFRMSSDENSILNLIYSCRSRSDDLNQCYMQKNDSIFLLYENHSIMNTIRPESVCLG